MTAFDRVESQNFAQSGKCQLDHLTSGDRHGALWVDLHRHVMNVLPLPYSAGNRELFVFRPAAGFRSRFLCLGFPSCLDHAARRRMGQTSYVRAQRLDAGKFRSRPIGLQQGRKHVGRAQCDLRNRGRRCRVLQRQHVLELMAQLAEFPEAASGRVALQRMHRPPNTAGCLRVAGRSLHLHRFVVQLLDEFLCALEKQLAQFRHPVLGGDGHAFASIRWYAVPLLRCTIWNFSVSPNRLSAWPTNR